MLNFKIIQPSSCPIRTKWKKNSAYILCLYLITSLRLVTLMKKKVVENQKISIYISVNVCNRGDERSWIYGIEATFLIEDCKLKNI